MYIEMTRTTLLKIRDLKVSEAIKQTAVKAVNDWNGKNLNGIVR